MLTPSLLSVVSYQIPSSVIASARSNPGLFSSFVSRTNGYTGAGTGLLRALAMTGVG